MLACPPALKHDAGSIVALTVAPQIDAGNVVHACPRLPSWPALPAQALCLAGVLDWLGSAVMQSEGSHTRLVMISVDAPSCTCSSCSVSDSCIEAKHTGVHTCCRPVGLCQQTAGYVVAGRTAPQDDSPP